MDERFSNEPIPVDHLPRLAEGAFASVDRRYVWGLLAGVATTALVVVAIVALIVWQSDALVVPVAIAAVVGVLLGAFAVVSVVESRRLAYLVREHDLSLRSGAFRHRVETVPFSRIQHVSVGRGLLERSFGLATLEVSSAGPDFSVPGLSVADAERIKALIAERAGVERETNDEVVRHAVDRDATLPPPAWPAP